MAVSVALPQVEFGGHGVFFFILKDMLLENMERYK